MKISSLLAASVLLAAAPAFAHGDHAHHEAEATPAPAAAKPKDEHPQPHGGLTKATSAHRHLELVRKPDGFDLYVYDADMKPVEGALADAKLVLVAGRAKSEMLLTGAGSTYTAKGAVPAGRLQVVVQAKVDGKAENVKFTFE